MKRKTELILALDVATKKDFVYWVDKTKDLVDFYKVGLVPFTALGQDAIAILKKRNKKIFLDLKFYDIPNTMIKASLNAARMNVDILDWHLSAGKDCLVKTLSGLKKETKKEKLKLPDIIGITVLTSAVSKTSTKSQVLKLATMGRDVGLSGVVMSGKEAAPARKKLGEKFKLICPGVRFKKGGDDQQRVVTPKDIKGIADYIVMGRPIYESKDPQKVISQILSDLS